MRHAFTLSTMPPEAHRRSPVRVRVPSETAGILPATDRPGTHVTFPYKPPKPLVKKKKKTRSE